MEQSRNTKSPEVVYSISNYVTTAQTIAQILGVDWKNNHYELPSYFGQGRVEAYSYPHASLMLSRFTTVNPVKIGRTTSPLKGHLAFDFILSGLSQYFENQATQEITQLQYGVYISTPSTESYGWFENDVLHEHLSMVVEHNWLSSYVDQQLPAILQSPNHPLFIFVPIPTTLFPSLLSLLQTKSESILRKQYLYSKLLELIIAIIDQMLRTNDSYEQHSFVPEELDQLFQVAAFIQQHLKKPLSVEGLSEKFGMNRNKMQALFKGVYGKTIAEYTRHLRMNFAYQLLTKNRQVSEVGYMLGYSNLSHFSAAFKKVHSINPSEVVKKQP